MEPASHLHHGIDYVEWTAPDLAAVKRFYAAAFGWVFTDWGDDYCDFTGGGIGGGFRRADGPRGGALVVLYSRDLAASERAVAAAGGRIVKPPFEFPGGRRFEFEDPAGNPLAVWSER